jgi:hypothetical protein
MYIYVGMFTDTPGCGLRCIESGNIRKQKVVDSSPDSTMKYDSENLRFPLWVRGLTIDVSAVKKKNPKNVYEQKKIGTDS